VHLTAEEYQILELLSLRKGATLTKEMFLNHLYGGMDEPMVASSSLCPCGGRSPRALRSARRKFTRVNPVDRRQPQ
jgi:hypothetical protein